MRKLLWFRRDLRIRDNPALHHVCQHPTDEVIALFIITPTTWQQHALGDTQIDFLLKNLKLLSSELWKLNIPLLIRETATFQSTPDLLMKIIKEHAIEAVYFNRQYEWDEQKRDQQFISLKPCPIYTFAETCLIPPDKILNQENQPFKVFTAYKKKWFKEISHHYHLPYQKPKARVKAATIPDVIPETIPFFKSSAAIQLWPAGELSAINQLKKFSAQYVDHYKVQRNFPAKNATSRLSPYLSLGILSPRQCLARLQLDKEIHEFHEFYDESAVSSFVNELIWRDFYKMIVYHYPHVCKHQAFLAQYRQMDWPNPPSYLERWQQGETGFPLVDAAMRQLNQTGWMHNRLRMLTAMFLTKILLVDWRLGEKYFSEKLIDYDFSANNGGWQWCASTGTDAAPYFRIFNPITQSQRFDPEGEFIRQYCPELKSLSAQLIHDPALNQANTSIVYPKKIVDYKKMREACLNFYKAYRHQG